MKKGTQILGCVPFFKLFCYYARRNIIFMAKATHLPYPDWVLKCRKPGTEIRRKDGKFYVYKVSSVYDKEKKRARKITGAYLGKITEAEGFIPSGKIKVSKTLPIVNSEKLTTREYGMSTFIERYCNDIIDILKIKFPNQWEWILACLYSRVTYQAPIKKIDYYYKRSHLGKKTDIILNPKNIGLLYRDLGANRQPLQSYMQAFLNNSTVALIDATDIISYSENLARPKIGQTKAGNYDPLFNLLYFYQPGTFSPAYYRLFDGNVKDIKMVQMAVEESGYKNAVIIADKGFSSKENYEILDQANLKYIMPLKRDSQKIRKDILELLPKTTNIFLYAGRVIYYSCYEDPDTITNEPPKRGRPKKTGQPKRWIHLFVDEEAMVKEKKDYVHRMLKHPTNYSEENFQNKLNDFGSFSVITNIDENEETIFQYYKSRVGVEVLFDGFKNTMHFDTPYMQDNEALEGWMFINHLALQIHHKIYQLLKEQNLLGKYSIMDFINYLSDVRIVKVNDSWIMETMPKTQIDMLQKLGLYIT